MTRAAAFELITDYVESEILGNGERRNGRKRRAKSMAKIKEKYWDRSAAKQSNASRCTAGSKFSLTICISAAV